MITMEVPYIPPQEAPIVLVQAADISKQPDYMLKACAEFSSGGGGGLTPQPRWWLRCWNRGTAKFQRKKL